MKKWMVKFFGSKSRYEQIRLVRNIVVLANSRSEVEDVLRHQLGYRVINGLKIREYAQDGD